MKATAISNGLAHTMFTSLVVVKARTNHGQYLQGQLHNTPLYSVSNHIVAFDWAMVSHNDKQCDSPDITTLENIPYKWQTSNSC